jgi:hypothetical protein
MYRLVVVDVEHHLVIRCSRPCYSTALHHHMAAAESGLRLSAEQLDCHSLDV